MIGDVVEDAEAEDDVAMLHLVDSLEHVREDEVVVCTGNAVELHVLPALEHEAALVFYPDDSGGTVVQRGEAPPSVMTRKIENSGSGVRIASPLM